VTPYLYSRAAEKGSSPEIELPPNSILGNSPEMRARIRALLGESPERGVYVAIRSLGRISYVPKKKLPLTLL
jgi:hypothetical protein